MDAQGQSESRSCPRGPGLHRQAAAPVQVGQDVAQVQGGGDGRGTPHRGIQAGQGGVPFQGQEDGESRTGQHPAGLAQPHLVGGQHQDTAGQRPLPEPPQPLGKAGAVGGEALPHHGHGAPVGQGDSCVQRGGPEPAKSDGISQVEDGGGQAVNDGQGVQPLQQHLPPPGRHRVVTQQFVQAGCLVFRQPAQPVGSEIVPAGGRQQGRSVGDGVGHPPFREPVHTGVHRAPGPAGKGRQVQPVGEGRLRQPSQQTGLAMGQGHSSTSPPAAGSSPSSPAGLRLLRCLLRPGPGS